MSILLFVFTCNKMLAFVLMAEGWLRDSGPINRKLLDAIKSLYAKTADKHRFGKCEAFRMMQKKESLWIYYWNIVLFTTGSKNGINEYLEIHFIIFEFMKKTSNIFKIRAKLWNLCVKKI